MKANPNNFPLPNPDDLDLVVVSWVRSNGYKSIEEWMLDSDYLLTDEGWVDLDDNPVDCFEQILAAMEAAGELR